MWEQTKWKKGTHAAIRTYLHLITAVQGMSFKLWKPQETSKRRWRHRQRAAAEQVESCPCVRAAARLAELHLQSDVEAGRLPSRPPPAGAPAALLSFKICLLSFLTPFFCQDNRKTARPILTELVGEAQHGFRKKSCNFGADPLTKLKHRFYLHGAWRRFVLSVFLVRFHKS